MGELIGRSHDEGIEGVFVVLAALVFRLCRLAALFFRPFDLIRRAQPDLDPGTEYLLERLLEQGGVAAVDRLEVELVWDLQNRDPLCEIEVDRNDPADPRGVSDLGNPGFTVFAD